MKNLFYIIFLVFLSYGKLFPSSIDWYIENSDLIIYGMPMSITDSCNNVEYVLFYNLFTLKGEEKDTFLVRIDHRSTAVPLCYVDNFRINYILFLSEKKGNKYYDFTILNQLFKIKRYWSWDFDSTYIKKNNLDSMFTYGYNYYRTTDITFLIDSLKLDSVTAKRASILCHYVEGIDSYPCNQRSKPDIFPDSLLLNVFNSCIYRKNKYTFKIIPEPWLFKYIMAKLGY